MNRAVKIMIAVAAVAALGAAGVKAVRNAKAEDAAAPAAKRYPIVVNTIQPRVGEQTLTLPYLAEVGNDEDVQLGTRISARVMMLKPSGSRVERGTIVARLDTTTIDSALAGTEDQIKAAQIAYDNLNAAHGRTLELLKVEGASVEQSQRELSDLAALEAKIAGLKQKALELKNDRSYALIASPVSGIVAETFGSVGATWSPGRPLLAVRADNGFYLRVRVPTALAIDGVLLEGGNYPAVALGSSSGALAEYKVYVNDRKLTSGDRVEVSVIVFRGKATRLPFDALLNRGGSSYVLVVEGERARAQEVHILRSAEEGVVVGDDLEGQSVVRAKPDILLRLAGGYALKVRE